jgi:spore maturation protein A
MNILFVVIISVSVLVAAVTGRLGAFTQGVFDGAKSAVEVSLYLLGIVSLWMGITKILDDAGLVAKIARFMRPAVRILFRNIPPDHPSLASITMNFLANLFGLGNAATPLGIKAMRDLRSLEPDSDDITFEMMLFVVINTASIQLIPFTVVGLLAQYGSSNPSAIILPTITATAVSAVTAVLILFAFRKFSKK